MKKSYCSNVAGGGMADTRAWGVSRRKLYCLVFDLWAWSFVDPETYLIMTPVKCSGCGKEYYEVAAIGIASVMCGAGNICISCDRDSLVSSGVSVVCDAPG